MTGDATSAASRSGGGRVGAKGGRDREADTLLVQGLRAQDGGAIREFFLRFRALLLAEARRARVQPAMRDEAVEDCLADLAIALAKPTAKVPKSLASYVAVAFRHRAERDGRRNRRRDAVTRSAAGEDERQLAEGVVQQLASEASRRAASPAVEGGEDEGGLSRALRGLTAALDAVLSDQDRQLLAWLGERVPQREIAAWLGITHGTARQRASRLRARLHRVATDYIASLRNESERAELARFLRRAEGAAPVAPKYEGGVEVGGGARGSDAAPSRNANGPSDDGRT